MFYKWNVIAFGFTGSGSKRSERNEKANGNKFIINK